MFPGDAAAARSAEEYVGLALELARPYVGRTGPNPSVGAVVGKDGEVIGRGRHEGPGLPHAERVALDEAGARANGADLFVTLEPCNFAGRTPPCTEAIIAAGIKRVFCGTSDPNPRVAGGGVKVLRDAGLEVSVGVKRYECRRLIEGYAKYISTGLPWVTVKYAMTFDGKTATRSGDSFWITGEKARARAHELRWEHAAVLVGAGTIRRDDPQLTVRLDGKKTAEGPIRVIISTDCKLPPGARVLETPPGTLVVTTGRSADPDRRLITEAGAEVIDVGEKDGRVDMVDALQALGERGLSSVLVEGGSEIVGGLFDAGFVDKVTVAVGPVVFGGREAKTPAGGKGVEKAADATRLSDASVEHLGGDFLITGYITDVDKFFPG